jgi:hypothetical protein
MDVFLDEAGYTGPDLVNADQPVFVLASTVLSADQATELLDASFGAKREREVKHSRLARSRRGREQVLDFIRQLDPTSRRATFFPTHKEYILLAYLLDFWIEPLMHGDGLSYYERGQNIAHANVCYITLGTVLGVKGRRELLRRCQVMIRDRTPFAYDSFWGMLYDAVRRHELIAKAMDTLVYAEQQLGWAHVMKLPAGLLDQGDYALLQTLQFWRVERPGEVFRLIHDTSRLIEERRAHWEALIDSSNPPAKVGQDRRTIEFPLPVSGLEIADSKAHPQLQVADLVAGAACTLMKAKALNVADDYATALDDAGLLSFVGGGNWPTSAISPDALETEGPVLADSADFIGQLLADHGVKS